MNSVELAGTAIGEGQPVYVVAELSANHLQSFERAVRLIEVASEAGANAVKLQTYTADTLTLDCDRPEFWIGSGSAWRGRRLHDLYREAFTPWDWQPRLREVALSLGLELFSSPFDETAIELLKGMEVPAYKIASPEIVDLPLIRRAAEIGKPVILSTGMATLAEIEEAVATVRGTGNDQLILLQCCSAYPAPPEEMNLRRIPHLSATFGAPVGLSDHTLGMVVPIAAVALGAVMVEKHLTLSRSDGGPDSSFSLEPDEFAAMMQAVRTAERSLGGVRYGAGRREAASLAFRRSLFVVRDVVAGTVLSERDVRSIRPAGGLHPRHLPDVIGRRAVRSLDRGTPLTWSLLAPPDPEEPSVS